jgi:hypothetical protein
MVNMRSRTGVRAMRLHSVGIVDMLQDSTAHIPSPVTRTLTSASYYQTGLIPKSVRLPCAQIFCRLIRVILFENIRMTVSVTT